MALLRSSDWSDQSSMITGKGVSLRYPQLGDFQAWSELRSDSRAFLTPWEPVWPADDLSRASFRRRIKRYQHDIREDVAYPFLVFRHEDDALVGGVTLSNIRRGVAQACSLGYWAGERYARQGYLSEAVRGVMPFIFKTLKLHRVEAACLPHNEASKALLRKVGFVEEGEARQYLRINGQWQDHVLFAALASDVT